MDVKRMFIDTISSFDLPVILQGSMTKDDEYPDSFFTFWNNSTDSQAFYNDSESQVIWDFDLNFYSNDPTTVNTMLLEAKTRLKASGFIVNGVGYDIISDEPTHTGRGINVFYIERM